MFGKKPEPQSNPFDVAKLALAMLGFASVFVSIMSGKPPRPR